MNALNNYILLFFSLIISTYSLIGQTNDLTDSEIEEHVSDLISKMTIEEKIGQMNLRGKSSRVKEIPSALKEAIKKGNVGALLNITNPEQVIELQKIATKESRLGIPLLFGRDVIHGHKTIFPIPLGQAASWNPTLVEKGAHIAAQEASSVGINWTFAPMIDISRDPRWGRIAESSGEDPYLTSIMGAAYIKGFQGNRLTDSDRIIACAKHFIGYGAVEGGRDYNTAQLSQKDLHNTYLSPFKAAAEAKVGTFMTSFNDVNGIPATANSYILQDVLRDQWKFKGFVVSDWDSVSGMIPHGYARNEKHAAQLGAMAGCDMEMTSTTYEKHLKPLFDEGSYTEVALNESVKAILRIKFRKGLFSKPFFENNYPPYSDTSLAAATKTAIQSFVLLKNESKILPITKAAGKKIAVIGPMANQPLEQLGTWIFDGDKNHSVTPLTSLKKHYGNENILFNEGLTHSRDRNHTQFKAAIKTAKQSDIIYFFAGEEAILSGEAHSRADISLPGAQIALINELSNLNKPIVLIIQAGRPITLEGILPKMDAVLMCWHPGTMAGPAIASVLTGENSPSGKLPVTWPKTVGQIPIYYNHTNTGRPVVPEKYVGIDDIPIAAWQSSLGNTSHYLDIGYTPEFPFGYGLTYSEFKYGKTSLSKTTLNRQDEITIRCDISNTGTVTATEIVQLYIRDKVGSYVRPIRELKGFERIEIPAKETKTVEFTLNTKDLAFYTPDSKWTIEPGEFDGWVAPNAASGEKFSFVVK